MLVLTWSETHASVYLGVTSAVRTNEIFLLVADVVALVITRAEANGGDLQAALQVGGDDG